jgi:hypothetical protein
VAGWIGGGQQAERTCGLGGGGYSLLFSSLQS